MNDLFFECSSGATKEMILSALSDLLPDPKKIGTILNDLNLPDLDIKVLSTNVNDIKGTNVSITCTLPTHRRTPADIVEIISNLNLADDVKKDVFGIFDLLSEAECHVHGKTKDKIHFHEVGQNDAIASIVGVCVIINMLDVKTVYSSPIKVGFGHVKCAHGILPIPAPATEYLLRGVPAYAGENEGEFCTPTGIATLKYYTKKFGNMPLMISENVGYGISTKIKGPLNLFRAYLGKIEE